MALHMSVEEIICLQKKVEHWEEQMQEGILT